METQQIVEVVNLLGDKGGNLLEKYSHWYFMSGLGWVIFGLALIVLSRWVNYGIDKWDDGLPVWAARSAIVFTGLLFIFTNFPDLLAPDGIAAHRMIQDIRGK